jgi:hypothetical protein
MWGLRLECCKKCGCTFQLRRGYYEGYGGWYEEDGLCYWCKREETVGKEQTDDEFDDYCECNDLFTGGTGPMGCTGAVIVMVIVCILCAWF